MKIRIPLVILALVATLPACSIRQDYPDTRRWALEVRRDAPAREPAPDTRLVVTRFDISRRYEGEQMVYRLADGTWESDFHHRFFVAPAEMIGEEAASWFRAARVTETVIDASSLVDATHGIEGTVTKLLGDYSKKDAPHAVVSMQLFGLGRSASGEVRILVSAGYEKRVAVADRTSDALVDGWEQALREIFTDFEESFAAAVAGDGAGGAR
ncbi:MAG: hypothetical protein ABFS86_20660 [Planctomycetota bacterium]